MIIELIGGRGSGKSTLIKKLKEQIPDTVSREGFRRNSNQVNLDDYNTFIRHELNYLEDEISEYKSYLNKDLVVLTKGPLETLLYIDFYIKEKHKDWSIEPLEEKMKELQSINLSKIILLDCDRKILELNIKNDLNKSRKNQDFWLRYNDYIIQRLKKLKDIDVIDCKSNDIDYKFRQLLSIIRKRGYDL